MTKIRNNIRGDSGLTDSQLMRSQKLFYKKTREALDELEEYAIMEMNRRRFQESARPPKQNLFSRIKNWFTK